MNKHSCDGCGMNFPLISVLKRKPNATADIHGGEEYPDLSGTVNFYQTAKGVIIYAQIHGFEKINTPCDKRFYAFHIHSGTDCGGTHDNPFEHAMTHYNPDNCEHPHHAGDLPPLIPNSIGYAVCAFLTDSFTVREIIGKTVIIHDKADDFKTQPSGDSGMKIACGVIKTVQPCSYV